MKTYRIAILGCRSRGTSAAKAYHAHPRTEIVALCDLVPERLETLGEIVNVSAHFNDLDEMIQQTAPDIVAIPTATEAHYPLCLRVLEHGVNIEVEKPLCIDLVEADEVLTKAKEKKRSRCRASSTAYESVDAGSRASLRRRKNRGPTLHLRQWKRLLRRLRVNEYRHTRCQ